MGSTAPIANHTIDPATGYLESNAYSNVFDANKKLVFLEMLSRAGFRIKRALDQVGISRNTFDKHVQIDRVFNESVNRLKELHVEHAEQVLADQALDPKKTIDRIFFLKCWKPERYNPVQSIHQDTTYKIIFDTPVNFIDKEKTLKKTIDAEIVSTQESNIQTVDSQQDKSASYGDIENTSPRVKSSDGSLANVPIKE